MAKGNGKPIRLDDDMKEIIERFAEENDLSRRQASKRLAKILKPRIKEFKLDKEIIF